MAASKRLTTSGVFGPNEDAELSSDWSEHSPVVSRLSSATSQYPSSKLGLDAGRPAFTRDNPPAASRRHGRNRDPETIVDEDEAQAVYAELDANW